MNSIVARAGVAVISKRWMKPSRPDVVSGVSRSDGSAVRMRAARRPACTSWPVAKPGWTSTPSMRIVTAAAVNVSSCSSPMLEPSSV